MPASRLCRLSDSSIRTSRSQAAEERPLSVLLARVSVRDDDVCPSVSPLMVVDVRSPAIDRQFDDSTGLLRGNFTASPPFWDAAWCGLLLLLSPPAEVDDDELDEDDAAAPLIFVLTTDMFGLEGVGVGVVVETMAPKVLGAA